MEAVPGRPASLRVFWRGDACDDHVTMVFVNVGARYELAIHNHPQFAAGLSCPGTDVLRIVDVSFDRDLEPNALTLSVQFP